MRFYGSKINSFFNKSIARSSAEANILEKSLPFFLFFGKFFISFLLYSGMFFMSSMSGVLKYSQMSSI
jgi:hypothetical protein